jgi:hypothetical protein
MINLGCRNQFSVGIAFQVYMDLCEGMWNSRNPLPWERINCNQNATVWATILYSALNSIDFSIFATIFQYNCLRLRTEQCKEHCTGTTRVHSVWHLRNASRNFHIMVGVSSLKYYEDCIISQCN